MINGAIFLDFDGVLFDTVKETYCVSMITCERANTISEIDFETQHYHYFHKFRYLIGPAWNYYFLIGAIDEKLKEPELEINQTLQIELENPKGNQHLLFEKRFFSSRRHLKKRDYACWESLIHPYPIVADLRKLMENHRASIYFITTRDRESVKHLLNTYDLEFVNGHIFSKEDLGKNSKKDLIQYLIKKNKITSSIFVDDLKSNLAACKSIQNMTLLHACWGYVAPEDRKDNKEQILRELKNIFKESGIEA
jgi:phosphoglycolate phosphatase-like HAD superfamily hydrolase